MGTVKFTDDATTTVAAALSAGDTSIRVASSTPFAGLLAVYGDFFYVTLRRNATGAKETVKVTNVTGTTWTVARAVGPKDVALSFSVGDGVYLRLGASLLQAAMNQGVTNYNIVAYGADPMGVVDSAAAIQAAINTCSAMGGSIYVPPGTYKLIPATVWVTEDSGDTNYAALFMKSGMSIVGDSGSSFRIADNQSTIGSPKPMAMFATNQQLQKVSFYNLEMDMNGDNNPLDTTPGSVPMLNPDAFPQNHISVRGGTRVLGYPAYVDDMRVERCRFINGPGTCAICHSQTNAYTQAPTVTIAGSVFTLPSSPAIYYVANNMAVVFSTTGTLPTGITAGVTYYMVNANPQALTFGVATSIGGTAITTSGSQSGTHNANVRGDRVGQRWEILNSKFYNNGNYSRDHSTITGSGLNGLRVDGNFFYTDPVNAMGRNPNDQQNNSSMTIGPRYAIETHGRNTLFTNNMVQNYFYVSWHTPASDGGNNDVIYSNNIANSVSGGGFSFMGNRASPPVMSNIKICDNTIHITDVGTLDHAVWGEVKPGVDLTDFVSQTDVTITGNVVTKDGTVNAACLVAITAQDISGEMQNRIVISGNVAKGTACGVYLATNGVSGCDIGNVFIESNTWLNLQPQGQFATNYPSSGSHSVSGIYAKIKGANNIKGIYTQNNITLSEDSHCGWGIYVNSSEGSSATITDLLDYGNIARGVLYGGIHDGVASGKLSITNYIGGFTNIFDSNGQFVVPGVPGVSEAGIYVGAKVPGGDANTFLAFNGGYATTYNAGLLGQDTVGLGGAALSVWGATSPGGAWDGLRIAAFVTGATQAATEFRAAGTLSATKIGLSATALSNPNMLFSSTPPTVSGFGTGASVLHNTGTAAFTIGVGTSNSSSTGTITMPSGAANGWALDIHNITDPTHGVIGYTVSGATITVTNYSRTTGLATNWTDSDVLAVKAVAY